MKLSLKTLTGKFFSVEVDAEDTIAAAKAKIEKDLNFPAEQQNLVHLGKVLADNVLVKDAGLVENSVVVIFIKKGKAPAPAAPPKQEAPPEQPPPQQQPQQQPQEPTPPITNQAPPPQPQVTQSSQNVNEEKLNAVTAMGFDKELATKALRASFGDVNVAVEYCMSGIPDLDGHDGGGGGYDDGDDDGEDLGGGGQGGQVPPEVQNIFNQLREHSQFAQLRALVNSAPNSIQLIAQQLSASNPALGQAISQYPDAFKAVLTGNDGGGTGGGTGGGQFQGGGGQYQRGGGQYQGGGGRGGGPPGLTAEDNEKVQQIIDMTQASRGSAVEAYIACGKNVEAAINFLFDS